MNNIAQYLPPNQVATDIKRARAAYLVRKAVRILTNHKYATSMLGKRHGPMMVHADRDFVLMRDSYNGATRVKINGRIVFRWDGYALIRFEKGHWLKRLESLYLCTRFGTDSTAIAA